MRAGQRDLRGPHHQASISRDAEVWDVAAVRVPLNEACWNGESYVNPAYAGANYQNAIKSYVHLLNANGLVAILDLHWTDGAYTGPSSGCSSAQAVCQKPMPDAAQAIPFWTSVASTFKGNDAVIFDLFNEPYPCPGHRQHRPSGWQCWLDGGTCAGHLLPGGRDAEHGQRGPLHRRQQRAHARRRWSTSNDLTGNGCRTSPPTPTTTWPRPGTPTTSTPARTGPAGQSRSPR